MANPAYTRSDLRTVEFPSRRTNPTWLSDARYGVVGSGSTNVTSDRFDILNNYEGLPCIIGAKIDDCVTVDTPVDILISATSDGPWVRLAKGTYVFDQGHPFGEKIFIAWYVNSPAEYDAILNESNSGGKETGRRVVFHINPR